MRTEHGTRSVLFVLLLLLPVPAPAGDVISGEALWNALRDGGRAVLVRHALAPGTGDPTDFTLGDCSTQRNLSDGGRRQARAIGEAFEERGVEVARVLTSRWCRSRQTAELAFGKDAVSEYPVLDSFFRDRSSEPEQTAAVRTEVASFSGSPGTLVLVTHQVNITALTGMAPRQGEGVVVEPEGEGFEVLGRLVLE